MSAAPWELRPAAPADAAALTRLHLQCLQETYGALYGQEFVDQLMTPSSLAEIAEEDESFLTEPGRWAVLAADRRTGRLVGFASASDRPMPWELEVVPDIAPQRQLVKLYTRAATHGSGLGAALLEAAVGASGPVYLWSMTGNDRAEAFYRKHGFHRFGPGLDAGGAWAGRLTYRMRRD